MKLLFENWRKYLNEGIMSLENWPEGYSIEIYKEDLFGVYDTAYYVGLFYGKSKAGWVNVDKVHINATKPEKRFYEDECNYKLFDNLYTLHVGVDEDIESQGFGPFLTDLALELAYTDGKYIIPAKLVGGAGTEGAVRLYDFYLDNRDDVEKLELYVECWEDYTGVLVPDDTPESFLYLYRKKPTILNSKLAKEIITVK